MAATLWTIMEQLLYEKVVPANSPAACLLKYGSRRSRRVNKTWLNVPPPSKYNQITDHLGVPSKMTAFSICGSEPRHHCNHTSHKSDQVHVKIRNSIPHLEKKEDNTFQCMVTVHREMS